MPDDIKKGLITYLLADAGVAAEVGTRIFPSVAPTTAAHPYITLQRIASPSIHHMDSAAGIVRDVFELDVWAKATETVGGSKIVFDATEAVRKAIDGFKRASMGVVKVIAVFITNQADDFNAPDDGSELGTHLTRIDFDIWYVRTVPTF